MINKQAGHVISCDEDYCKNSELLPKEGINAALRIAIRRGWSHQVGKDRCPECLDKAIQKASNYFGATSIPFDFLIKEFSRMKDTACFYGFKNYSNDKHINHIYNEGQVLGIEECLRIVYRLRDKVEGH